MSTPAQIAANQANAKLSTGPTSVAGKQIASQNSVKHHLTGKGNPALPGEEDAVAEYVEGFIQAYAPVGVPERTLVINSLKTTGGCHALTLWKLLSLRKS